MLLRASGTVVMAAALLAGGCGGSSTQGLRVVTPQDLVDLERGERAREALTGPQPADANGEVDGETPGVIQEVIDPLGDDDPGSDIGAIPPAPGAEGEPRRGSEGGSDSGDAPAASPPAEGTGPVPATGRRAVAARTAEQMVPWNNPVTSREWLVDGLVGQINGRPIFADAFLDPIADRLGQASNETNNRNEARQFIIMIVSERFEQWVNNELIIAEAESLLTPEQKQGLFAFLRDFQEGEVLRRGGTRSAAEESLFEDFGYNIEEYMAITRNEVLAADLLRRRVQPRAIVTWRDMEREFARRSELYAPGATIEIGRIALLTTRDAEKIQRVTSAFEQGRDFSEVAIEMEIVEEGRWREFVLGEEGIDALSEVLVDEVVEQLRELPAGKATTPIVQGSSTVWFSVLQIERPEARNIFDRDVQIELRAELQALRDAEERTRYITNLRRRWIAENIEDMRVRLIDIALRRYLR